jgi:hypothetical protein
VDYLRQSLDFSHAKTPLPSMCAFTQTRQPSEHGGIFLVTIYFINAAECKGFVPYRAMAARFCINFFTESAAFPLYF